MNLASDEVIRVLTFLLPGFVAAAVFYWFAPHIKPGTFERVVQALIFTAIVKALTATFSLSVVFGISILEPWAPDLRTVIMKTLTAAIPSSNDREILLSVPAAVVLALIAVRVSNNDTIHRILRRYRVTRETSYPSEWYSAFARHDDCYVVLHMTGQRRLYGWPEEWPKHPDQGHFRIRDAEWLLDDARVPATGVSAILIPAGEVEMVEFMRLQSSEGE